MLTKFSRAPFSTLQGTLGGSPVMGLTQLTPQDRSLLSQLRPGLAVCGAYGPSSPLCPSWAHFPGRPAHSWQTPNLWVKDLGCL